MYGYFVEGDRIFYVIRCIVNGFLLKKIIGGKVKEI